MKIVKAKKESLEEKYIAGDMDRQAYKKWLTQLETERVNAEEIIEKLNAPLARIWAKFQEKI
ncbi:MAG: hypothetical protein JSS78_02155 [Bacteroidetes bacterium]|nr:hypothetical protein [Bacteroidota bacterium]